MTPQTPDGYRSEGFRDLVANFSGFSVDASWPYGAAGPNLPFSLITARYMAESHRANALEFSKHSKQGEPPR